MGVEEPGGTKAETTNARRYLGEYGGLQSGRDWAPVRKIGLLQKGCFGTCRLTDSDDNSFEEQVRLLRSISDGEPRRKQTTCCPPNSTK